MANNSAATAGANPLTLPNVIHFLQNESSRYERDRNYWELERAEMKARIAKLEGERKSNERMKDWYLRRLRMLEVALQEERLRSDPAAKPLPSLIDEDHAEKKSRSTRKGRIEHDEAYLELIQSAQAGLRAQGGRNKSRAYLQKCLTEVTYLVNAHPSITANKPVSLQSFEQMHEAPQNPIPGPQPMREQSLQNIDVPERQASPSPMANNYFDEPDLDANGVHQVQSGQPIDELEGTIDLTSGDEPVVKIQHTYDSQGNFIESSPNPAMAPSGSSIVEAETYNKASASTRNSFWDQDDESLPKHTVQSAPKLRRIAGPRTLPSTTKTISVLRRADDVWIATAAKSTIYLYRNEDTEPVLKLVGHEGCINSLKLDHVDERTQVLYSAGEDMVIRKWALNLELIDKPSENTNPAVTFISHTEPITDVAITDGIYLVSSSVDASIRKWDVDNGDAKEVWRIPGPATGIFPTMLCNFSNNEFAAAYSDGSIKFYNIHNDRPLLSFFDGKLDTGATATVVSLAAIQFGWQSTFLCINLGEDGLRFYDIQPVKLLETIPFSEARGAITSLCSLQEENQFVVGTSKGQVITYTHHGNQIQEIDLSKKGKDVQITCLGATRWSNPNPTSLIVGTSYDERYHYSIEKEDAKEMESASEAGESKHGN